jgi:excinuclease ABC subunit B
MTKDMQAAADEMEFERAAEIRDRLLLLKDMELGLKPASRMLLSQPLKKEEPQRARKAGQARRRRK